MAPSLSIIVHYWRLNELATIQHDHIEMEGAVMLSLSFHPQGGTKQLKCTPLLGVQNSENVPPLYILGGTKQRKCTPLLGVQFEGNVPPPTLKMGGENSIFEGSFINGRCLFIYCLFLDKIRLMDFSMYPLCTPYTVSLSLSLSFYVLEVKL